MSDEVKKVEKAAEKGVPLSEDPVTLLLLAADILDRKRAGRVKSYRSVARRIRQLAARLVELG